jgi:acetyl-CoA C-acetyltransferase
VAEAFVLETLRTARTNASPRGGFASVSPVDLLVHLQRELVTRTGVDPGRIEDVIIGCASQKRRAGREHRPDRDHAGELGRRARRHHQPVLRLRHRRGGAGGRIRGGDLELAAAGGVESVSRVPMFSDGGPLFCDPALVTRVGSVFMGIAADLVATIEGSERHDLDAYGLETQRKAARAWEAGFFDRSLVPFARPDGVVVERDEHLRPGTTLESLSALEPAFVRQGAEGQDALALAAHPEVGEIRHLHTVGTSPALADASALVLIGSEDAAKRIGVAPRARIVASRCACVSGVTWTPGRSG